MSDLARVSAPVPRRTAKDWSGLFDSVEEFDLEVTHLEGRLPEGLVGTLYRNGPGGRDFAASFFDGDGMIRALRIGPDGRVHFRSRFVATEKYLAEKGSPRPLRRQVGTNLPGGFLRNAFRVPAHEANTSVVSMAGRLWALAEGGHPYEIDAETLETGELTNFDGTLGPRTAFTAHPHVDPETGDTVAFGNDFGARPGIRTFRVDRAGGLHAIGRVPLKDVGFIHDYALTRHWMTFLIPPIVASVPRFLLGLTSFFDSIRWRPELGLRIAMQPRAGGEPVMLETDACMTGHVVSAWEERDTVVVDTCQLDTWAPIGEAAANHRTSDWDGYGGQSVRRYRIDPRTGRVSSEEICSLPVEFPRIDERRETREARWAYFAANGSPGEGGWFRGVLKLDRRSGATDFFAFGDGKVATEPIFLPRPGGSDEDDGWVAVFVHDAVAGVTEIAILDARRLADGPVCTLKPGINAGITFHGSWAPA
jgi:all-trans-8'-apo-beta-carotenal 15,15'-oxygenase